MAQAIKTIGSTTDGKPSKLGALIRRFADKSTGLPTHWTLHNQDIDALLLALFQEIDETVLPREITLSTDSDTVVRLLISNRRLLCLDIDNSPDHPDQPASEEIENVAQVYTSQLQNVFKRSGEIHVRFTSRASASASDSKSCTASSLAASVGLPLTAPGQSNGLDSFCGHLEQMALAAVRYRSGPEQPVSKGDGDLTALLIGIAERSRNNSKKSGRLPGISAVQPYCSIVQISDTKSLMTVSGQTEKALFLLSPEDAHNAMAEWDNLYCDRP